MLVLKVLVLKRLVLKMLTMLVAGVFVSKLAILGMLEALVLSKAWKYTCNHHESWNQGNIALHERLE